MAAVFFGFMWLTPRNEAVTEPEREQESAAAAQAVAAVDSLSATEARPLCSPTVLMRRDYPTE